MRYFLVAFVTCLLAMGLQAQEPREPRPVSLDFSILGPGGGLRDAAGSGAGAGSGIAYVVHTRANGRMTLALRLDMSSFEDAREHRGAYGVGMGPELTFYFKPDFKGAYFNLGFMVSDWSLTSRTGGTATGELKDRHYTRAGSSMALGYRFSGHWSLEAVYRSVNLDQDLRLDSLGLGFRFRI